jgi:hypothetical protein
MDMDPGEVILMPGSGGIAASPVISHFLLNIAEMH